MRSVGQGASIRSTPTGTNDTARYRSPQGAIEMSLQTAPAANSRSDGKRNAILKGAKAVFLRHGFGHATMNAVAATAGVSKMTVYRHFGDKEELFAGVITDLCERIVGEDLEPMLQRPPEQALRLFAAKMIDIVFAPETIELHRIVIAESRRFPKLGRFFYASGPEQCIAALTAYFKRHRGHPRLRIGDPRRTAEEFLELIRGYAHLRIMLGIDRSLRPREIEARIESAVRHVLK
jgi:TetR/AcrR family transcriptional repressor of mexJK operon